MCWAYSSSITQQIKSCDLATWTYFLLFLRFSFANMKNLNVVSSINTNMCTFRLKFHHLISYLGKHLHLKGKFNLNNDIYFRILKEVRTDYLYWRKILWNFTKVVKLFYVETGMVFDRRSLLFGKQLLLHEIPFHHLSPQSQVEFLQIPLENSVCE